MALDQTEAVILRHHALRETSWRLVVFGRRTGKLTLVAKGARRPQRLSSAAALQPLSRVWLTYYRRRSEWHLLGRYELVDYHPLLRQRLAHWLLASYWAELLDSLTQPENVHPELYDLLISGLVWLDADRTADDLETAKAFYETRLLDAVGAWPSAHECVGCRGPLWSPAGTAQTLRYSARFEGWLCEHCQSRDRFVVGVDRQGLERLEAWRNQSWEALAGSFTRPIQSDRLWLSGVIQAHAGRTIRSLAVWQRLNSVASRKSQVACEK